MTGTGAGVGAVVVLIWWCIDHGGCIDVWAVLIFRLYCDGLCIDIMEAVLLRRLHYYWDCTDVMVDVLRWWGLY